MKPVAQLRARARTCATAAISAPRPRHAVDVRHRVHVLRLELARVPVHRSGNDLRALRLGKRRHLVARRINVQHFAAWAPIPATAPAPATADAWSAMRSPAGALPYCPAWAHEGQINRTNPCGMPHRKDMSDRGRVEKSNSRSLLLDRGELGHWK